MADKAGAVFDEIGRDDYVNRTNTPEHLTRLVRQFERKGLEKTKAEKVAERKRAHEERYRGKEKYIDADEK